MPKHNNHYIIESNSPYMVVLNMSGDKDFGELVQLEKEKKLRSEHPTVVPRAVLKQTPDMLLEEYRDEESGLTLRKFKDSVVLARADGRGRIWIEKGNEDLVRRILRTLRAVDKTVGLDEEGLMLPEELTEEQKRKKLGGRPRNVIR